jgi:predicted negative regulator of RcsB-dependent stress response
MAFDLQEQEQIDSLKIFWNQWGKWIATAVAVLAVGYLGYKGYGIYQAKQVEAAAAVFSEVDAALQGQDLAKVKSTTARIEKDYAGTPFAPRAAFLAAKAGFDKNEPAYAEAQLNWVVANAKESSLVALAQLRLASVLMDEKRYDAAIALLNRAHDAAFDAAYFDAKGDVLILKGDKGGARDAYKASLAKLAGDAPSRQYVQTKLDALGG